MGLSRSEALAFHRTTAELERATINRALDNARSYLIAKRIVAEAQRGGIDPEILILAAEVAKNADR
jgi:hypothetical protein